MTLPVTESRSIIVNELKGFLRVSVPLAKPDTITLLNPNADPKAKYFQKFLSTIRQIPRGRVATYGDVAYAAGFPGMARQVAWALHASIPGVPWQRVVGSGGKILLGGEHGFEQRMRLQQEGVTFIGLRVDMNAHHHSFFKSKKNSLKKKSVSKKKPGKKKR